MPEYKHLDSSLDIASLSTGISQGGMETLKNTINVDVLNEVYKVIDDVSTIESALNMAWNGESKNRFWEMFIERSNDVKDHLQNEYYDLCDRLTEIEQHYVRQDDALLIDEK